MPMKAVMSPARSLASRSGGRCAMARSANAVDRLGAKLERELAPNPGRTRRFSKRGSRPSEPGYRIDVIDPGGACWRSFPPDARSSPTSVPDGRRSATRCRPPPLSSSRATPRSVPYSRTHFRSAVTHAARSSRKEGPERSLRRASELLATRGKDWLGALAVVSRARFRRGALDIVELEPVKSSATPRGWTSCHAAMCSASPADE